jgi:triacylglycerol lipase
MTYSAGMFFARCALLAAACVTGCHGAPLIGAPDGSTPEAGVPAAIDAGGDAGVVARDAGPSLGPPYPIVLLHGMAGFDQLQNLPLGVTYFEGVVEDLRQHGEPEVFVTLAPPYDTSEVRAVAIAAQIDAILASTHRAKVNLVGHSQGGLDARILAGSNGLAYGDRIASVTTIATPHRGTRLTDAALGLLAGAPKADVDALTDALLKLLQKTFYEVQTDPNLREQLVTLSQKQQLTVFNPKYVDDPRVTYASYAGRTNLQSGLFDCSAKFPNEPLRLDPANPAFLPTASLLAGPLNHSNDGLVTVESAKWGTFMQCVPADHLKQVGVLSLSQKNLVSGFDHREFFRTVVARIRATGN